LVNLRKRVYHYLGLPVSIGVAPTKTLAKIANHYAKTHDEFNGVCDWNKFSTTQQDELLIHLPVKEVWGIGWASAKKLAKNDIVTTFQLREASLRTVRKLLHVLGERTVLELTGTPAHTVDPEHHVQKGIMYTRSFGEKVETIDAILAAIATFAFRAGMKMYKLGMATSYVGITIRTSFHTKELIVLRDYQVFADPLLSLV
jgi:DNA polymerase V